MPSERSPQAPGETLELSGTVSSGSASTLTNTAVASASDATSVSATDTATLSPQADLTISKTDDANGHAVPGESLTYTITLTNTGPSDATNVVVNDLPPATFTNVTTPNIPAGVNYNSLTGVFTIGALAAGATETLTLSGTVSSSATGSLTNTATASASDATSVSATVTDSLAPQTNLSITITDNFGGSSITGAFGSLGSGHVITYTITVSNLGASDALNVVVVDTTPEAIMHLSPEPLPAGITFNSGNNTFSAFTLAAGASVTLVLDTNTIFIAGSGNFTSIVSASAINAGSVEASDTDDVSD